MGKPGTKAGDKKAISMDWRINPGSTVLNLRKQFFITGKNLDSVSISHGSSLKLEKDELSGGGSKLKVFITVLPLAEYPDSTGIDKPGIRELVISSTEGNKQTLSLQVVDEDPNKGGKELKLITEEP